MFIDARGDGRTMRVSLHPERGVVVLSLWAGTTCRASFQLPLDDATRLVDLLGPEDPGDPGTAYPGPADEEPDSMHVTGAIAVPELPQAS
jgi:hypothetical protein